ncbi:MAG: hypothetical protein JWL98_608, partial [Xanthomonadaceae bacterium]|nr:hypothetical protein [Xanthomonadaceae bacterium]
GGPLPPLSQRPLPLQATNPIPLTARATAAVDTVLQVDASERRHLRHSRALLALPYFSFAQGLRRNRS